MPPFAAARSLRTADRRTLAWIGAFTAGLLLKAAVPLLALLAAGVHERPLAEVCSVYGVRLQAAPAAPSHDDGAAGGLDHHGQHCALAGFLALAAPQPAAAAGWLPAAPAAPDGATAPAAHDAADLAARWHARLLHAPPVLRFVG